MTQRDSIVLTNTENYFKYAHHYRKLIVDNLEKFSSVDDDEKHVLLDELTIYLKDLIKYTNKINITVLERMADKEMVERGIKLLAEYRRIILYTEKFITGKKFLDSAIYNLESIIERSKIDRVDYYKYASSESDLAYKVGYILASPKRQAEFTSVMHKIANGKMSVDEFKKLFNYIRKYLPEVADKQRKVNESFISFSKFKKYNQNDI